MNGFTYLSKNGISIICKYDSAHWVEEHLQHALWTKCGPDDVRYGLYTNNYKT